MGIKAVVDGERVEFNHSTNTVVPNAWFYSHKKDQAIFYNRDQDRLFLVQGEDKKNGKKHWKILYFSSVESIQAIFNARTFVENYASQPWRDLKWYHINRKV